jgi:hypothetical protein
MDTNQRTANSEAECPERGTDFLQKETKETKRLETKE